MDTEGTQNEQNTAKRKSVNDVARGLTKGNKTAGIMIAICMVVLGILIFMAPLITGLGIAYIVTAGLVVYGIFQIIAYFRTPAENKNGWTLANGIIFTIIGILILAESLGAVGGKMNMLYTFSFVIGFFALFGGINQLASYSAFKKSGEPGAGLVMASGIINLILGIFIICSPIAGWFAMEWIFAIYLIVGGIALFAEACSGKLARKQ